MPSINQLTCDCGSTFFYTVRAEQFAAGGYGTAEFRSLSGSPKTLHVCLCGKPAIPKPSHYGAHTSAGMAEEDFRKSVEAANKSRDQRNLDQVAKIAASPEEVDELRGQVDEVRKVVDDLVKSKGSKSKAKG